ncbi:MAG: hypothetical protein JF589_11090 [Gemmatimonadetes bacterium]|nr:hypothetical protein [Gemmatimonadota bacterium]
MSAAALRSRGFFRFDLGSIDRIPPGEGQTFLVDGRGVLVWVGGRETWGANG